MADPTMAQIDDLERRIRQSNRDDGTFGAAVDDTFELVHSIAAKLLAARARIAKLEQEPPMAMIDFGYGLDLQGIRDDLKFLDDVRRENQQLRATEVSVALNEVERLRGLIREYVQATDGLAVDDSAEAQNRYERAEDALREVARG